MSAPMMSHVCTHRHTQIKLYVDGPKCHKEMTSANIFGFYPKEGSHEHKAQIFIHKKVFQDKYLNLDTIKLLLSYISFSLQATISDGKFMVSSSVSYNIPSMAILQFNESLASFTAFKVGLFQFYGTFIYPQVTSMCSSTTDRHLKKASHWGLGHRLSGRAWDTSKNYSKGQNSTKAPKICLS